jgi:hypothetical protein
MQNFNWKPEWKILLGKLRSRRENNIKMDLQEIDCEGMDWIHLTENSFRWRDAVNTAIHFRVL